MLLRFHPGHLLGEVAGLGMIHTEPGSIRACFFLNKIVVLKFWSPT